MKTLEAQVQEILLNEVIELAAKQNTSVDQIVSLALTAQVSVWRTRESIASPALGLRLARNGKLEFESNTCCA